MVCRLCFPRVICLDRPVSSSCSIPDQSLRDRGTIRVAPTCACKMTG